MSRKQKGEGVGGASLPSFPFLSLYPKPKGEGRERDRGRSGSRDRSEAAGLRPEGVKEMRLLKTNVLLRFVNSYVVDSPQPANLSYL